MADKDKNVSFAPPLPRIHGPKLPSFSVTGNAQIDFLKPLGQSEDQDACVWEVQIEGKRYALKMEYCSETAPFLTRGLKKEESYVDYYDPFNCECRVYGRLRDEERQDLAVRAYGYLLLTPEQEKFVAEKETGDPQPQGLEILDGDGFWERWEEHRGQTVRAIVKELVVPRPGETGPLEFQASHVPQMWNDLDTLHSLGILVRDIHYANYLSGKLVDFSRAWTMYHPSLDLIPPSSYQAVRKTEVLDLEQLIYDFWTQNPSVVPEDFKLPQGLLNCTGSNLACGESPREYNWQAREEEVFVPEDLFS
ncbi:hypothetical protein KVR01_003065 [Diaporthe batatas]|uniref:uncharacterized protein n=1 Tax=Diaporthe batatas TaxID=748121 RepID=UPI001D041E25|nr:uncharacterized protein KVR01_003065 [Diaporthe batatas]KAG8167376.1 hypothetical protein KVR01_003065 [Diaporthe batatas]